MALHLCGEDPWVAAGEGGTEFLRTSWCHFNVQSRCFVFSFNYSGFSLEGTQRSEEKLPRSVLPCHLMGPVDWTQVSGPGIFWLLFWAVFFGDGVWLRLNSQWSSFCSPEYPKTPGVSHCDWVSLTLGEQNIQVLCYSTTFPDPCSHRLTWLMATY